MTTYINFSYPREVPVPELMGQLARTHEGVTILSMDIVGFTSMAKEFHPCHTLDACSRTHEVRRYTTQFSECT